MGIQNMLKFGGMGLVADMLAGPMTMGQGMIMGGLAGLFTPDAHDLDAAYEGGRFQDRPLRSFGLPMMDSLFGHTQGGPNDPPPTERAMPGWAGAAVAGLGVLSLLSGGGPFSFPLYTFAAGLTPYNSGGLIPLAWSSGLIPSWGWSAGILT